MKNQIFYQTLKGLTALGMKDCDDLKTIFKPEHQHIIVC